MTPTTREQKAKSHATQDHWQVGSLAPHSLPSFPKKPFLNVEYLPADKSGGLGWGERVEGRLVFTQRELRPQEQYLQVKGSGPPNHASHRESIWYPFSLRASWLHRKSLKRCPDLTTVNS